MYNLNPPRHKLNDKIDTTAQMMQYFYQLFSFISSSCYIKGIMFPYIFNLADSNVDNIHEN